MGCGAFCYVAAGMTRLLPLAAAVLLAVSPGFAAAQGYKAPSKPADERLTDAESEIQALWHSYFAVVRDDLPNTKGSVDCSTGRYEEIKPTNSFLVFFVACERIEQHGTGYRASIAIGNPHTFAFGRVSGTLSYGEHLAAALTNQKQRVPFAMSSDLRPGTWTRIDVPIATAAAKDVAKIIVEFAAGGAIERGGGEAPGRSTSAPQYGLLRHP
jgi:hypothetical protein